MGLQKLSSALGIASWTHAQLNWMWLRAWNLRTPINSFIGATKVTVRNRITCVITIHLRLKRNDWTNSSKVSLLLSNWRCWNRMAQHGQVYCTDHHKIDKLRSYLPCFRRKTWRANFVGLLRCWWWTSTRRPFRELGSRHFNEQHMLKLLGLLAFYSFCSKGPLLIVYWPL